MSLLWTTLLILVTFWVKYLTKLLSPTLGPPKVCNYLTLPNIIWNSKAVITAIEAPRLDPTVIISAEGWFWSIP